VLQTVTYIQGERVTDFFEEKAGEKAIRLQAQAELVAAMVFVG